MKLNITAEAKEAMIKDAQQAFPNECCGFLFGNDSVAFRNISVALPVNNASNANKARKFEISEKDYMKAERYADEQGLSLVGIYHSHPDHPAVPSEYDLKSALPFFSYVIIAVENGIAKQILSWQKNAKNKFEEEIITS
jgi:proteasome lid subunit RPN8/RPN11